MIYKLFPIKDTTLYNEKPTLNSGLDPIIECSSYFYNGDYYISRILMEFSKDEIQKLFIDHLQSYITYSSNLRMFSAYASGIKDNSIIEIYPISGSWESGKGKYTDYPITENGSSWLWKDEINSVLWDNEGGDYYDSGSALQYYFLPITQSLNKYSSLDINVDISSIVYLFWMGGSLNNGILIKQSDYIENNDLLGNETILRYFSRDTNTIYSPYLEFKWDDSTFNTGSSDNVIIDTLDFYLSSYNNHKYYYNNGIIDFRLAVTPKYPVRQFTTSSQYNTNYYLPFTTSLYSLIDMDTNQTLIDFDSTYTKISADEKSSFVKLDMGGLEPKRWYKLLIKTYIDNQTLIIDNGINFYIEEYGSRFD